MIFNYKNSYSASSLVTKLPEKSGTFGIRGLLEAWMNSKLTALLVATL